MRRFLAITLLAIFGMPLVAPLVASAASARANMPACCRRGGKHHCEMSLRNFSNLVDQAPEFRAPREHCPYYPVQTTSPSNSFALSAAPAIFAKLVSHPAFHAQTESKWRISRDRARQKRGPPSSIHS